MRHSRLTGYECGSRDHRQILDFIYQLADCEDDKIETLLKIKRQEMGIDESKE